MNVRTTFGITFGFLAVGLSWPAYSDDYSDAVNALNPAHYYRLNETVADTITPTVADTGSAPLFGIHEGNWSGGSNAQVHVPGPNLPGFDASNGAILLHDAGAINLGDGSTFASSMMSVALWFNNADPTWDGTYGDRMFQNHPVWSYSSLPA
ncbi:MAG: hypothetical protein JW829_12730 [Pirellulales bacterium]|nr:hypothetical protein [Pirellulales bacterium]